jgi:hypothetical protein
MKKHNSPSHPQPAFHVDENVSLEEQIARRAYELWHHRKCQPGSEMHDWLQAEREINEWHQAKLNHG